MTGDPFDAIPRGQYGALLVDPPWRFKTWSQRNQTRAAARYYSVMSLDDIKAMPVAELAAPDCALFMWAINPMLPHAFEVLDAWGFKYSTKVFEWAKRTKRDSGWHMGLGYWSRQNTESCLLATRGHPKRLSRSVRQLMVAPVRSHSEKPEDIHQRVAALVGGPYLELFARRTRPGWDAFGDELDGFVGGDQQQLAA